MIKMTFDGLKVIKRVEKTKISKGIGRGLVALWWCGALLETSSSRTRPTHVLGETKNVIRWH